MYVEIFEWIVQGFERTRIHIHNDGIIVDLYIWLRFDQILIKYQLLINKMKTQGTTMNNNSTILTFKQK